jgi:hypothetical protein
MKESEITYAELVKRLKKHGLKETEAGITMKLKRGTFSATCLSGSDGIGRDSARGNLAHLLIFQLAEMAANTRSVGCLRCGVLVENSLTMTP